MRLCCEVKYKYQNQTSIENIWNEHVLSIVFDTVFRCEALSSVSIEGTHASYLVEADLREGPV